MSGNRIETIFAFIFFSLQVCLQMLFLKVELERLARDLNSVERVYKLNQTISWGKSKYTKIFFQIFS